MAASILAGWQSLLFPVLPGYLAIPVACVTRKFTGWVFPPVPTEDLTLNNAWAWGPLVFLFNSVVLVPFAAALLCSFPKDRRLSRTWDIVVLAVGLISLFVGGCAILFRADSERRLSQDYFFFSTYVPIIIAGAGASLGSCLLLRTTRHGPEHESLLHPN